MFANNLKTLRKMRGLSQEELAIRLHVVRQTISKWEKGLSVPDADVLICLADEFDVSVSKLLGAPIEDETEINAVAEQLSRINEQLAIKNRRSRRIWQIIALILIAFVVLFTLLSVLGTTVYTQVRVVHEAEPVAIGAEEGERLASTVMGSS